MNDTTKSVQPLKERGSESIGVFLLLFLVPAAFTYLSGMLLVVAIVDDSTIGDAGTIRITYLAICYAIMAIACYLRGKATDRRWLTLFPVLGGLFDMFFGIIPFVPSVMNVVALVVGIQSRKV